MACPTALLTLRGNHLHLMLLFQNLKHRPQPGGVNPVIVRQQYIQRLPPASVITQPLLVSLIMYAIPPALAKAFSGARGAGRVGGLMS